MKKLFALIGLLGLVTGMGGALNAQETLDRVGLGGHFAEGGVEKAIKFKFSAMPGDKFVVAYGQDKDTITAEADITEFSHTFSPDLIGVNIELSSLNQTSHLHHFEMDSTDHYSTINFENCPMLKSIHVTHNTFENFTFRNCPALTFLDCSYNKITSLFFSPDSNWYDNLTYLNCSHNDIQVFDATEAIETLDLSYNRRLRYLDLFACKALTDLTVRDNDSLKTLNVSNLPLQHLTCTECQNLSEINADNCRLQTLDVSGNPALKRLDFIDNQLTSLILKDCPVLERLFCANNQLTSLTINDCPALISINCDYNQLSYIDLSPCKNLQEFYCRNNRFSSLKIPDDMVLYQLACDSNHIPPSVLASLRKQCENASFHPQLIALPPLPIGQTLDLHDEMQGTDYNAEYTIYRDSTEADKRFYTIRNGLFAFHKAGIYRIQLSCRLDRLDVVFVHYDLTVVDSITRPTFSVPSGKVKRGTDVTLSTTTPDARILYTIDGSTPDTKDALEYASPIRINSPMTIKAITVCDTVISQVATATYTIDTVANEHDSRASKLRIYAQDRTIYLSEEVGEIEVFTMNGHCIYRGYDTAIPVKRSGIYIVSATGKRWKVTVR